MGRFLSSTHVDSNARDEHDDGEGVEELPPGIDAESREALVGSVHHLCETGRVIDRAD